MAHKARRHQYRSPRRFAVEVTIREISRTCQDLKKKHFETRGEAEEVAKSLGLRAYKCRCGEFCMTSQIND